MHTTLRHFVLFACVACGAGCTVDDSSDACGSGPGITATPFDGAQLAEKSLSLTFDGGPSASSLELGEFLFANGVQATFFVAGQAAQGFESTLEAFKDYGHLVGNLGYSGRRLTDVPDPVAEIRKTDQLITPYVTGDMFLLRAPEGAIDGKVVDLLNDDGLDKYVGHVHWDVGDTAGEFRVDTDCWTADVNAGNCAQGYMEAIRIEKRGIVRLHDMDVRTLALVRDIVPQLQSEGFSFVRVDSIPAVRRELEQAGATPGLIAGGKACNDYE
jgi:peptidoglycan/xylan/chitin deacetylase (PgdA/CDA1 family)